MHYYISNSLSIGIRFTRRMQTYFPPCQLYHLFSNFAIVWYIPSISLPLMKLFEFLHVSLFHVQLFKLFKIRYSSGVDCYKFIELICEWEASHWNLCGCSKLRSSLYKDYFKDVIIIKKAIKYLYPDHSTETGKTYNPVFLIEYTWAFFYCLVVIILLNIARNQENSASTFRLCIL